MLTNMKFLLLFFCRPLIWFSVLLKSKVNINISNYEYKFLRLDHRLSRGSSTSSFLSLASRFNDKRSIIPKLKFDNCDHINFALSNISLSGYSLFSSLDYEFDINEDFPAFKYRHVDGDIIGPRHKIINDVLTSTLPGGRVDVPVESYCYTDWFKQIINSKDYQYLAELYFGSQAFLMYTTMWELIGTSNEYTRPLSAQEFHWDWDVINPLNVFVLCSATTISDGPLEYVRGTHRILPYPHDGPWSPQMLNSLGLTSEIVPLIGPKGTVYVCDNTGLHRDSIPSRQGYKRWLQLTFSPSLITSFNPNPYVQPHSVKC